mmetsp:Transcript_28244/g.61896  ORF Transcript_28244/g.61896 Transcript_28244/m.61896 type:complete len:265 (+) Transcript_28244:561-1355(+)
MSEMSPPVNPESPQRWFCACCCSMWSQSTRAAMASTMGTARGTTQGSWRPRARSSDSTFSRVTVICLLVMVDVGLNAICTTTVSPFVMPPWMPPERLVRVRTSPESSTKNSSLCWLPVMSVPSKPLPTVNPLVAGMDIIALAKSASSFANTGAPSPLGTLRITQVTTPPQLSPLTRTSSMALIIFSAASWSGHRTMLLSTSSSVKLSRSTASVFTSLTADTKARISTPATVLRIFFATAPAATRPMVSRAEERPPPAIARTPYL